MKGKKKSRTIEGEFLLHRHERGTPKRCDEKYGKITNEELGHVFCRDQSRDDSSTGGGTKRRMSRTF